MAAGLRRWREKKNQERKQKKIQHIFTRIRVRFNYTHAYTRRRAYYYYYYSRKSEQRVTRVYE